MSIKSKLAIDADLSSWKSNPLDANIGNNKPLLLPDTLNTILTELNENIKNLNDSTFNLSNGITISNITNLQTSLNGKENADVTILKQVNIVDNLISTSTTQPLSANQGKILKDTIDALPSLNSSTKLGEGTANEVTSLEIRTHINSRQFHFLQTEIDHVNLLNKGVYNHTQIDAHIDDNTTHFTKGSISHTEISDTGVNTHIDIDNHIDDTNNPHDVTLNQVYSKSGFSFIKGKLLVANGSSLVELPVGSNGQVLKANSSTLTGLEWNSDSGEVNTITSLGSQVDLFIGKLGSDLQLRTLQSMNTKLTIVNDGNVTKFTVNENNIDHQNLSGSGVNTHSQIDAHIADTTNPHGTNINDITVATTKGDMLVYTGTQHERLSVGSNNQVLIADSTQTTGVKWSSDLSTVVSHTTNTSNPHNTTLSSVIDAEGLSDSKGTIYVSSGTDTIALPSGINGQVLSVNSSQVSGLQWITPTGENNLGSNLSGGGVGVFDSKSGATLRFRTIDSGDSSINVSLNGTTIELTVDESNIAHQALNGAGSNTHSQIDNHIAASSNPHSVTKVQVGLGNVPNIDTSNVDNHISGTTNKVFTSVNQTKLSSIATNATANPVQSAITALTDNSGGTENNTIDAIVGSGADTEINNNFADLTAKMNTVLIALQNANIIG